MAARKTSDLDSAYLQCAGAGTRLQHIQGNLFRNERLERQFDEWQLQQFARAGEKFDIKKLKHGFAMPSGVRVRLLPRPARRRMPAGPPSRPPRSRAL